MHKHRAHHLDIAATDSTLDGSALRGGVPARDLRVSGMGVRGARPARLGLFRRPGVAWGLLCLAVDGAMLGLAILASQLRATAAGVPVAPALWLAIFPLLVLGLFWLRGMYARRLRLQILDDVRAVIALTAVAGMAVISLRALLHDDPFVAAQTIREWLFAAVYLGAGRAALTWGQRLTWARGEERRPTLIVGAGHVGHLVARRLLTHPETGLQPVGFLDKEPLDASDDIMERVPVLGASWDLEHVIERFGVQHVIVTFSTAPHSVLLAVLERCRERGIAVSLIPRLFEKVTDRVHVEHIAGLPLLSADAANPRGWQFTVKYGLDRVLALLAIVLVAPALGAAALATWASLGRPIFYSQVRVGRNGRAFRIFKFRTMRPGAGQSSPDPLQLVVADMAPGGVEGEDRRTGVGAFLRRTSIDELPQLLNVLKGDMSLVGPRPERPEYAHFFEQHVHAYDERHRVKSGITGWAQVHDLRGRTSVSDRVEWDNYYIENWSLWLDFKILLMTIAAVFREVE